MSVKPHIAFKGDLNSWLIFDKKLSLAFEHLSASSRAFINSVFFFFNSKCLIIYVDKVYKQINWSLFNSLGILSITQIAPITYPSGVVNG